MIYQTLIDTAQEASISKVDSEILAVGRTGGKADQQTKRGIVWVKMNLRGSIFGGKMVGISFSGVEIGGCQEPI